MQFVKNSKNLHFSFSVPTPQEELTDLADQIGEEFDDQFEKVFGGSCLTDDGCSVISYCRRTGSKR